MNGVNAEIGLVRLLAWIIVSCRPCLIFYCKSEISHWHPEIQTVLYLCNRLLFCSEILYKQTNKKQYRLCQICYRLFPHKISETQLYNWKTRPTHCKNNDTSQMFCFRNSESLRMERRVSLNVGRGPGSFNCVCRGAGRSVNMLLNACKHCGWTDPKQVGLQLVWTHSNKVVRRGTTSLSKNFIQLFANAVNKTKKGLAA